MSKLVRKEEVLKLRLRGYSYNEINTRTGVPKSTLSGWLKDTKLSKKAQERLKGRVYQGTLNGLVKRNKLQTKLARDRAQKTRYKSQSEVPKLSKRDLCMLGVALYWGEGHKKIIRVKGKEKTAHSISFTNTDSDMIKIFMRYVREILEISDDNIRINLRLFKEGNESLAIKYWSKITKLNKDHFQKTVRVVSKSSEGKRKFNQLPHGTIQVRINDTERFYRIMGWIDGISKQA